jgi:membrane-bound lytic murein transglycosylase A
VEGLIALVAALGASGCSVWRTFGGPLFGAGPSWVDDLGSTSLRAAVEHTAPVWERRGDVAAVAAARALAQGLEATQDPRLLDDLVRRHFRVRRVSSSLLLTGYYEPELPARAQPDATFRFPIYGRPADLVRVRPDRFACPCPTIEGRVADGELVAYPSRGEIDAGALAAQGLEIAWANDALDVFLLQVQGSGRLRYPDGRTTGVHFAGTNGRPYSSLGRVMIDRGLLSPGQAGIPQIRQAFTRLSPAQRHEVMAANERFVFFALSDGPIRGALSVPLTAGRSVAIDPQQVPLGSILYLDTPSFRRFVVGQDTGAAIKGAHADLFVGHGVAAGEVAGRLKEKGSLWLLEPRTPAAPSRGLP